MADAEVAEAAADAEAAVTDILCGNKNRLLMQFHITGRCNLRCKHCYRTEGDIEPLSYDEVINVIEQYKTLRNSYNRQHGIKKRGHINITGGEPFYRKDIREILRYLGDNKEYFSYGVLSNGALIDDEIIKILKETEVSFVQLSIDGNREMHDSLRAPGDYDRTMKKAELLEKNGIKTYISFTANKENMRYIPYVAKECRKRKITKLWSDRIVPIGNGEELQSLSITKDDMHDYISCMKKAQGSFVTRKLHPKTVVTMNRALQFMNSDGNIYSCSAGDSLITVDEKGDIMPCRRMPVICGNIRESTLSQVYYDNDVFKKLRARLIPEECKDCRYSNMCRGGAKCQSYALYGSFFRADPGCGLR